MPIESKRFLIVPLLSSAARIPFPSATSALAVASKSVISVLLLAWNVSQERLYPRELFGRRGHDPAGADPPRGVDLGPAVRGVPDTRTDDDDARAGVRKRHHRPVLRDHLADEIIAGVG